MDETPSLICKKKQKTEIDFYICLTCQKNSKSEIIVKAATIEYIDKGLNNIKEHFRFKDVSMSQLLEQLGDKNSQDIVNNNGFYHCQCYPGYYKQKKRLKELKKDLTKQSVKQQHLQVN